MNRQGESVCGKAPLVSIGMPVYNEERFLTSALDSLLAQDFRNFELVISDNASQDATQEICLAYAARDARIRYIRKAVNCGAVENFNTVFRAASGKYFLWASGHDLWHRSYISRCLELLEHDSLVVLCSSQVRVIGARGELVEIVTEGIDTRGLDTFARFRATLWGLARLPYSDPIYGLIRSEALRGTGLCRNVWGTDNLILLELSLAGAFAHLREPLYSRRVNRDHQADVETWTERYLEALSPKNRDRRWKLSYSRMGFEYMGIVQRSPFTLSQKLRLLGEIWRSVLGRSWRGLLFHDVVCGPLRFIFGHRAVYEFKKHAYRLAKSVGAYR
jgi:glycosyltransferase involved in cell wall biosynthesis